MLSIKFFQITFALILFNSLAYSCDDILKSSSNEAAKERFKKDCDYQDRYARVRSIFRKHNLNITNVAEYKALRFIDRASWNNNLFSNKLPINLIYTPAPITWDIWDEAINSIFPSDESKNILINDLDKSNWLSNQYISYLNRVLLTNGVFSSKGSGTDPFSKPGTMRSHLVPAVGFCASENYSYIDNMLKQSNRALKNYQYKWEKAAGISLKNVIKKMNGEKWKKATFEMDMIISSGGCSNGRGNFVYYISSKDVIKSVDWIRIFLKYNLQKYVDGHPIIPPIELSAIIQKWLVSIHAFADGNGRTSRALQDLILMNFDLPFAPGGDLQNDSLENVNVYIENNYLQIDRMLKMLESCSDELENGLELSDRCKQSNDLFRN